MATYIRKISTSVSLNNTDKTDKVRNNCIGSLQQERILGAWAGEVLREFLELIPLYK